MKFRKIFRYNWRTQKELLLGIEDKKQQVAMALAMQERDIALNIADSDDIARGHCLCGYPLTVYGKCMAYPEEHTFRCGEELPENWRTGALIGREAV